MSIEINMANKIEFLISFLIFSFLLECQSLKRIKPYPEEPPDYKGINMSIIDANIVDGKIFSKKVLYVKCELVNISEDTIFTTDLGISHNYFTIVTPNGSIYREKSPLYVREPTKIYEGETKIWEDSLILYNEDEFWLYRETGIYKFYWVFHNKVLNQPIELEKLEDRSFKIIKN